MQCLQKKSKAAGRSRFAPPFPGGAGTSVSSGSKENTDAGPAVPRAGSAAIKPYSAFTSMRRGLAASVRGTLRVSTPSLRLASTRAASSSLERAKLR